MRLKTLKEFEEMGCIFGKDGNIFHPDSNVVLTKDLIEILGDRHDLRPGRGPLYPKEWMLVEQIHRPLIK